MSLGPLQALAFAADFAVEITKQNPYIVAAMDDVEHAILQSWQRLSRRLVSDSTELHRRLARRKKLLTLTRPPPAWCLAVRASDPRLDALTRPTGLPPAPREPPRQPRHIRLQKNVHDLTLDVCTIKRLCAPVTLDPPGMTLDEVVACSKAVFMTRCPPSV